MLRLTPSSRLSSAAASASSAPAARVPSHQEERDGLVLMGTYRKGVMKREADRRLFQGLPCANLERVLSPQQVPHHLLMSCFPPLPRGWVNGVMGIRELA